MKSGSEIGVGSEECYRTGSGVLYGLGYGDTTGQLWRLLPWFDGNDTRYGLLLLAVKLKPSWG